jgi:hypothetical protein
MLDLRARRLKQDASQVERDLRDYSAIAETVSGQTIEFLRARSSPRS